jgi:hypothetical protein
MSIGVEEKLTYSKLTIQKFLEIEAAGYSRGLVINCSFTLG